MVVRKLIEGQDVDAVLLARGRSQVRGRPAIANVIINQLRNGGSYVAAPNLVMQSGPLALIISANETLSSPQ